MSRRSAPIWVLLLLLLAPSARATTSVRLDTRGLVHGSSDIVVGRVAATRCLWDEGRRHIFTEVEIEVSRSLKGEPGERITLRQLGGELDGMRYTVPGAPLFRPGEEALLFVWRDRDGQAQVNGLGQGKFDVRRDPETGEALIQRRLPGLEIRDPRTLAQVRAGEAPADIPLGRMLNEIERILQEDGR